MKKIHLHTAAADNLGQFQDSGTDMVVGDEVKAGHIDPERARAMVASKGAVEVRDTRAAPPRASRPAKASKAKASSARPARAAATVPPAPGRPAADTGEGNAPDTGKS